MSNDPRVGFRVVCKTVADDVEPGDVTIVPTEATDGVAFSQRELTAQSAVYSELYVRLIAGLATILAERFQVGVAASEALAREGIVSATHFFCDRLLRLDRLVAVHGAHALTVTAADCDPRTYAIADFRQRAMRSHEFNQSLLVRLARLWGLAVDGPPLAVAASPQVTGFVNRNFSGAPLRTRAVRRLRRQLRHVRERVWPATAGRITVLSLAYAGPWMEDRGFFGRRGFRNMRAAVVPERVPADAELRRCVFGELTRAAAADLRTSLESMGLGFRDCDGRLAEEFLDYLVDYYPTDLLEGMPANLARSRAALDVAPGSAVFSAETGNTEIAFLLAAACETGKERIGWQQGGHYGYEGDYVAGNELEYPMFDRFVTWGWRRFPEHPALRQVAAVPMPSVWLAERRKYWRGHFVPVHRRADGASSWDLLYLSNKVYPFPPAPSGAAVSRSDHLQAFNQLLLDLVAAAKQRELRILHKPFDAATVRLAGRCFAELHRIGGTDYAIGGAGQKGLTPDLVNACRVVVWDQPGTGFLECLTSGIPTMVLWPRAYNFELPWVERLFEELQRTRVVHRGVPSLLDAVTDFNRSPETWMLEPQRRAAVDEFTAEYAFAPDDWVQPWRDFLRALS